MATVRDSDGLLTEHELHVFDVDGVRLPVLGHVGGGGDGVVQEVVGDVQQGVLDVLVQLLVGVHLLDQVLQALAVQDLRERVQRSRRNQSPRKIG